MSSSLRHFYPEIEPYATHALKVGGGHTLYIEESGNPKGVSVVYLHGGPGGMAKSKHRRFFDPKKYRVICFDQRGCGRSTPYGSLKQNTTAYLVADMEKIREALGIEKWIIFGGSWGSTLGIAYCASYPKRVKHAILFGVFLGRAEEGKHAFGIGGLNSQLYPDQFENFLSILKGNERRDPLKSYAKILKSEKDKRRNRAARAWIAWESTLYTMDRVPRTEINAYLNEMEKSGALLNNALFETTYFSKRCFIDHDDLFKKLKKLSKIPCTIIQGRFDLVCPPQTAWDVHKAWPHSKMILLPGEGHANDTPLMLDALIRTTDAIMRKKR
jgi:proline iminopeptidase